MEACLSSSNGSRDFQIEASVASHNPTQRKDVEILHFKRLCMSVSESLSVLTLTTLIKMPPVRQQAPRTLTMI